MPISLCLISDITDPGSKAFELSHDDSVVNIFVIHKDGQFTAFVNSCPHTGVNLEWLEDQFLDMDNAFIQCSTHDALFEIESGLCVAGPCINKSLTPVTLHIDNDNLLVELPPPTLTT